ncbi:hypothetical protein CNO14_05945 (plasmid) [Borrelia miyamotoi]|uniref:Uncharacterized protein n=2 Tax=Borrelia miyamotoi TaxID=47466 RepID=A0AAQ3CMZ3_9SPIR|nr:hypothetical protein [Borrelia miyamotoi]AHH06006.1 Hypothetical protein BOM_1463 [Borrelia miyamotoi FR64b]ATQ15509.1 hypothetical protein CNO14_05945 [Borrelia miyamotoi]ATQ17907.1 hypothetical protein CNO12_06360 [Borrelia miyamotoi]ATQ19133.1 hypothetical protein CNO11_06230 [Borrelia miyamotoi]ATQ20416.1 hypothetical protein CNO10_06495 [Borrelia miyamotoi]
MRFNLKYLAKRLYVKLDRFWTTYMCDEVQLKKTDVNFPIFNLEDIDYEYIYSYLKVGIKEICR